MRRGVSHEASATLIGSMEQPDDTRLVPCFRGHWNAPGRSLCESCGAVLEPWHPPEHADDEDILPAAEPRTEPARSRRSLVSALGARRRHLAR
jgi:hypothetical protein